MELSKALPIVRAAVKQVNVQSGLINGARTLHSSGYMGRQEKTTGDEKKRVDEKFNTSAGDTVDSLKQRASQATPVKPGLDSASAGRRTDGERSGSPSREGNKSYQGVQQGGQGGKYDNIAKGSSKMGTEGPSAKGSSQMGAEGNTWDANQRQAKESTAQKPGAADKTIVEKASDMLKGATNTVSEKLGLKK